MPDMVALYHHLYDLPTLLHNETVTNKEEKQVNKRGDF
jgi:hypothetical protein